LHHKAENRSNASGEHFGWRWIEMAYFYEKFEANIVEQNAHSHNKKVAHELRPPSHLRLFEADVSTQPKTAKKSDRECEYERRNVGTDGNRADVQHIVAEDEIVENEVQHPVENHIGTTRTTIAK
jgi:hypothetical protein